MKIAVLVCGLCNTRPEYFKHVFSAFEILRSFGISVDFYLHHWNETNIFPEGYTEDKSDKFYHRIPIDNTAIHKDLHEYIKPKYVVYSNVSDMSIGSSFINTQATYVTYVNTTAQFYAFDRLINIHDLSEYDYILKWRYDLIYNGKEVAVILRDMINDAISGINQLDIPGTSDLGDLNLHGVKDTWFGFNSYIIDKFKNFHTDICYRDKSVTGRHGRLFPIVEHQFHNFILKNRINTRERIFSSRLIRGDTTLPLGFDDGKINQSEFIDSLPLSTPEHIKHRYE